MDCPRRVGPCSVYALATAADRTQEDNSFVKSLINNTFFAEPSLFTAAEENKRPHCLMRCGNRPGSATARIAVAEENNLARKCLN